jgi:hypothetical protein
VKRIRLTFHASQRCQSRGTNENEVRQAVIRGVRETAKKGRVLFRLNFQYNRTWRGRHYAIKQVAPVVIEKTDQIIVVTVYTFFF